MRDTELWHHVEARREDGAPAIFRIRELDARLEQPHIFVVELPYPLTELSRLPDATGYRRFDVFKEQWLDPACLALGWTPVAIKIEDGSLRADRRSAGPPNARRRRHRSYRRIDGSHEDHDADPRAVAQGGIEAQIEESGKVENESET